MAFDFMMPPQGVQGELPPGMPPEAMATPVPMVPPPQAMPLPAQGQAQAPDPMAAALPQVMQEEGAQANSPDGMGFFDKLRTDPKMSQAMMMVGLRMMQGQKPGQDAMGMVGDAMMAGATAHNMLKFNESQKAQRDQEFGLKKEQAQVSMDNTRASTAQTQQNTDFKAQLQPDELAKAKELVLKYKQENQLDKLKMVGEGIRNDPETVRKLIAADLNAKNASANASNASAGASSAHAEATRYGTTTKQKDAEMRDWAANGTPEQKKQARDYFTADDPTARAAAGKQGQVEDLIKRANPGYTDEQVAASALELQSSQKGERLMALKALVDNGTDQQREAALAELNGIVLAKKQAPSGTGAMAGGDRAAWEKARNSVAVGKTYTGPDGLTYTRNK